MNKIENDKKKLVVVIAILAAIFLIVLVLLIAVVSGKGSSEEKKGQETAESSQDDTPEEFKETNPGQMEGNAEKICIENTADSYAETRKTVTLHLEGYAKNIFCGWEWTMQNQLTSYAKEHGIGAENAVVLLYAGYDGQTDTHSFYLQFDDADGTILLGTYQPYSSKVQPSDKTLDEILEEKESQGDEGEPDELPEETATPTPAATPEPTKAPVIPYTDLQILEVPAELADFLGTDASNLPAGLAGFLAANHMEGNEYATYTGEYQLKGNKAVFDVELKNKTLIHVMYDGEYTFEFR